MDNANLLFFWGGGVVIIDTQQQKVSSVQRGSVHCFEGAGRSLWIAKRLCTFMHIIDLGQYQFLFSPEKVLRKIMFSPSR